MEYIEDCIGNKVRVGDEILHVAYLRGGFDKRNIFKVTKICKGGVSTTAHKYVSRFIKVIREAE